MRRRLTILLLAIGLLLTACGGGEGPIETVNQTFFKINEGYVNAAAVTGILDKATVLMDNEEDARADAAAKLAEEWSKAKYSTSAVTNVGYVAYPRLVVDDRRVGQWRVGNNYLYLPPGTYQNIPDGDSEVVEVDALCVDSGKIAFKTDFDGTLLVKPARAACYNIPLAGWLVEDSLTVLPSELAYQRQTEGTYEFNGPGTYPNQIASKWVREPAPVVNAGSFGIYVDPISGEVTVLKPGVYTNVVPGFVRYYMGTTLHYTSRSDFDARCPDVVKNAGSYCMSSVDEVTIAGTPRHAKFDVDMDFVFIDPNTDMTTLSMYKSLPEIASTVRDILEMRLRGYIRSLCADMTHDDLKADLGKVACANRIADRLNAEFLGKVPLRVVNFEIRSIDFQDDETRTAEAALIDRINLAAQEKLAIERELENLASGKALNAQLAENIRNVINIDDGISCAELMVLEGLGYINPIDWTKVPEGMCIASSINTNLTISPK